MSRKNIIRTLVACALLVSAGAYAQSSSQANVPFAFTAGNVQLPAGDYLIHQKAESHFISIVDVKSGKVVFAFAAEQQSLPMDASAKLIFHRFGEQHYLAAVWTGGGGTAKILSITAEEKQSRAHLVATNASGNNMQAVLALK